MTSQGSDGVNVEKFRCSYESNAEWRLRERFLKAHFDKLEVDRLLCLSHCYVNVRQMGCTYPQEVMKQLKELWKDLGEDDISDITKLPSRIRGIEPVKFVRSADQAKLGRDNGNEISPPKKFCPVGMNFVKSSSEYKSSDVTVHDDHKQNVDVSLDDNPFRSHSNIMKGSGLGYGTPRYATTGVSDIDVKFRTLSSIVKDVKNQFGSGKNSIEVLQMSVDKAKMSMDCTFKDIVGSQYAHTFVCIITIDFVEVAEGKGTNKKTAKHAAFDWALSKLTCTNVFVDHANPEKKVLLSSNENTRPEIQYNNKPSSVQTADNTCLYESNFKSISIGNKQKSNSLCGDITKFIIFEHVDFEKSNALSILHQSCTANKALLEFHYNPDLNVEDVHCQIDIEGQFIAEVSAVGKINAKNIASIRALEELRKMCWTIKIKQSVDCPSDDTLSRDTVMGEIQKQVQTIPNDNIGNKLLRKMGWSGGGVGVEGNIGREEPVAVSMEQIVNREGLGLNTADGMKNFRQNIKEVVENYAKSDTQEDMAFTSDFTKEERAYIHTISQRLGLKSLSRGKGEDRHLTLSRKRTTNQLFDHLLREGGSTHKYELIPPEGSGFY